MSRRKKSSITRRDFLVGVSAAATSLLGAQYLSFDAFAATKDAQSLKVAVEFNSHAASAIVAMDKKFYEAEGLQLNAYESYSTGAALAAAMTQGSINAAYICLIPAINAYANGGVPLKVVCSTHLYGYGLAVNPDVIKSVKDLEKPGIRIGCLREGTSVDTVMHQTMEKFDLDKKLVFSQTKRMSPPKMIFAVRAKQLDAVFLPEHWLTLTTQSGFSILLSAKDVWPDMIGSVVVVREELIRSEPETVRKLVQATEKSTNWMHDNPKESARITASFLSFENDKANPNDITVNKEDFKISPDQIAQSMGRLEYSTSINKKVVQKIIDNAARLGNIKQTFSADEILDLRFLS